jgi:hypothetical protein
MHHNFPEPKTYALKQSTGDVLSGHIGEFLVGNNRWAGFIEKGWRKPQLRGRFRRIAALQ